MSDDELELRLLRFEQAWLLRDPCQVADFLGDPSSTAPALRERLLVELICCDLEFRWRNSRDARPLTLDDYVAQFPELVSLDGLPLELIGEEYRVRRRWGDRPAIAEYLSRFAERRDEVRAELDRVEAEIEAESSTPRPAPRRSLPAGPVEVDPDVRLHSHHDFLLRRLIGAGRMGKVYEAWQHSASREVAVKFLRKSFLQNPGVVRRFIGEARTVALLRHPNIVGTQGLGRTPAGAYFIVMDLVTGTDLARLSGRRAIAPDEAVSWLLDACGALEHAHERGVVHCDLKPANVLLDDGGRILVTDFGLARSLAEDTPWAAEVEGTAPFMAPEQAARCWGPIDARTDVYGLGAVLFALLTGRPPFVGRRLPDVLAQVISARPADSPASLRPGIPEPVGELCRKCLSKSPAARFQSVRELCLALAAVRPARP